VAVRCRNRRRTAELGDLLRLNALLRQLRSATEGRRLGPLVRVPGVSYETIYLSLFIHTRGAGGERDARAHAQQGRPG
jgi:hypothetical protein